MPPKGPGKDGFGLSEVTALAYLAVTVRRAAGGAAALLLLLLLLLLPLSTVVAQDADSVGDVAAQCNSSNAALRAWCTEVALGFQAAQGGIGLVSTGAGSVFPGNASTLGRRLGATPRLAGNIQLTSLRLSLPTVVDEEGAPAGDETFFMPVVKATIGVGLFDGFAPLPTVGGVLAVDGIAAANAVFLSDGRGFRNNVYGYALGLRVGLLRESFTLPGISVSGMLGSTTTVRMGESDASSPAEMEFDLSTMSLRATVGKDFLLLGLLGGVGYDRYRSDADLAARVSTAPGEPPETGTMSPRDFPTGRTVFFAGATLTYLVAQLAAEAGWSPGYDDVTGRLLNGDSGAYSPSGGTTFFTLAARIIL